MCPNPNRLVQSSKMEEYFQQKCVTSDAALESQATIPTWTTTRRCECVMVQENAQASGASRAVLASILRMTTASNKTRLVALVALEQSLVYHAPATSDKLTVLDFSSDWQCLEAALTETPAESPLLSKIQSQLDALLDKGSAAKPLPSARPHVVVVDSLNVLLEIYPLSRVLQWLRVIRRDPRVGSVVFRLNVAALLDSSVAQTLALETTAVVQVETHASLRAYPILAKERRREIPKRMHGLVLLLRKKKNGRTSESVEYFHASNGQLQYSSSDDDVPATPSTTQPLPPQNEKKTVATRASPSTTASPFSSSASSSTVSATTGSGRALPVGVDDVSFNLSISAEEEAAKRNVQLPYMHQGGASTGTTNNLLFIDDDDPDWDDDDLDDDLDI